MVLDHQFHADTIHRAYPNYAQIPYGQQAAKVENRKLARQFAWEMVGYTLARRPSRIIRYAYVLPRLLRCLLDQHYNSSILWLGPAVLNLLQLETLARRGSVDQQPDSRVGWFAQKCRSTKWTRTLLISFTHPK